MRPLTADKFMAMSLPKKCREAFQAVVKNQKIDNPIDSEGDPAHQSFRRPRFNLKAVYVYEQLMSEKRDKNGRLKLNPQKGGFFDPASDARILYLSVSGLRNSRVLFEELAHAHTRQIIIKCGTEFIGVQNASSTERAEKNWHHYRCHRDIFFALLQADESELLKLSPEEREYTTSQTNDLKSVVA